MPIVTRRHVVHGSAAEPLYFMWQRASSTEQEEPSITLKEIVLADKDETFLSKAVCCKSGCYSTLRRLAKLRREIEELKREVTNKIRSVYKHRSRATTAATTHDSPKTSRQGDCTQGGSHRKNGRKKRLV